MSNTSTGVVRTFYDDLSSGNLDGLFARFADQIDWREADGFPYADRNPYTTPQAVAEGVLGRLVADWDGFTVTPERFLGDGEVVAVFGRYAGTFKATGKSIDVPMAHVWTVRDGAVTSFRQYVDTLVVDKATRP